MIQEDTPVVLAPRGHRGLYYPKQSHAVSSSWPSSCINPGGSRCMQFNVAKEVTQRVRKTRSKVTIKLCMVGIPAFTSGPKM